MRPVRTDVHDQGYEPRTPSARCQEQGKARKTPSTLCRILMRSCANPFLGSLSSIQCQWCPRFQWRLGSFERWPYVSAQPLDRGRISPLPPGVRQSNGAGGSQLRPGRVIRFYGPFNRKRYRTCIARARENPRNLQDSGGFLVSDTGIEPATSSVSGKRATAAPIAQACVDQTVILRGGDGI